MKFTKKHIKGLLRTLSNFINSRSELFMSYSGDLYLPIDDLEYYSSADDKKNISKDFMAVGKDFKKATQKAQIKVGHGKTATTE